MDTTLKAALSGGSITFEQALAVLDGSIGDLSSVLEVATAIRRRHFGDRAILCSILNAKSGRCSENCAFCAQSTHHKCDIATYPFMTGEEIVRHRAAVLPQTRRFSIVTSGCSLDQGEIDQLCETIRRNPSETIDWCASLGVLTETQLQQLKDAGLKRFHHNLETAESYFDTICTTHSYADRVETVRAAKRIGLEVCSGGLFGLGESLEQRVELAMTLRDLAVDAIPINFLLPVEGTPAAAWEIEPMTPEMAIRMIAMFRLVCQTQEIRVCAGRERHLGALEDQIFAAGANGMMIGGYLTLRGRSVEGDLEMIRRAGMDV